MVDEERDMASAMSNRPETVNPGSNTTLAVVATDAPWTKADLAKLAQMAHDGLAMVIRPAHTPLDGDTIFALSTSRGPAPSDVPATISMTMAGALASRTLARAVAQAIRAATTLHGVPALSDLPFGSPSGSGSVSH